MCRNNFNIILICVITVAFSCKKENRWDCTKSAGNITIEERILDPFDSLVVFDNVEVFIRMDSGYKAEVYSGENLIPFIITSLNKRQLEIRNDNLCNWVRSYKIPIQVTVFCPVLLKVRNGGTAPITGLDTIKTYRIRIDAVNTGDVNLLLNTVFGDCSATGSGDLILSGEVGVLAIWSIGTQWVRCANLKTGYSFFDISTSGDVYIDVNKVLGIRHRGQGNIYYTGDPWEISYFRTGSGNLIKVQ